MTAVRVDGEPRPVGRELDRVLLALRIVGETRDRSGRRVDAVEVVVLVALLVAREHQSLVVRRPHIEGTERARRLAVRELPDRARLQIEDVELDATALVPVEGDLVARVRQHRVVERGKSPQLAHIDGSARRGGRGHAGMLAAATAARALARSSAAPSTRRCWHRGAEAGTGCDSRRCPSRRGGDAR